MNNITLLDTVFNFSSTHNGIPCITKHDAQRACDRVWFTAKQLEKWSELPLTTLRRKLEILVEKGRITLNDNAITKNELCADIQQISIPSAGATGITKQTKIFNLNVLNQLAMICIESDRLNDVAKHFSDILAEVETTGSYAIQKKSPIQEKEEREDELILLTVKSPNIESRMIALGSLKDLWTEEANKKVETADKRAYSAMGTASAKSKENIKLKAENEDLKVRLQESTNYLCVKAIPWFSKYFMIPKEKESESVYSVVGKRLTALSKKLNYEIKNIPDPRYPKGVGSYHTDVIEIFRKQLDNDATILAKYRI